MCWSSRTVLLLAHVDMPSGMSMRVLLLGRSTTTTEGTCRYMDRGHTRVPCMHLDTVYRQHTEHEGRMMWQLGWNPT